jgi:hypothetical protein
METAPKKLSVSAILLGIIGGTRWKLRLRRLEFAALTKHLKTGLPGNSIVLRTRRSNLASVYV